MRIRPFEYHAAASLKDALEKIENYGSEAKILAGGTDLVLAMKHKEIQPRHIISLHRVKELEFVREEGSIIRFGTMNRYADLVANTALNQSLPILCEAVSLIGSWQIRNVATIGGNLCTASPAADSAAPLLALDSRVIVADAEGEKEISLGSFFTGPGETILRPNQILKEIIVDRPKAQSAGCYLKLMRKKAVDLSLVGVAFQAEVDPADKRLACVRIGLGGVAPTPIRAPEAEAIFTGLSYEDAFKRIPKAAKAAVAATAPISDIRASAEYRRTIVEVFVQGAAEKVIKALQDGENV